MFQDRMEVQVIRDQIIKHSMQRNIQNLQDLRYDDRQYGLHSVRAGGATEVTNGGSMSKRLLKIHGRWRKIWQTICKYTKISTADLV